MATKKPREDDRPAEERIEELRSTVRFYGFAAAKAIASILGQRAGEMPCPLCQRTLRFSTASNGHFAARCETDKCINAME